MTLLRLATLSAAGLLVTTSAATAQEHRHADPGQEVGRLGQAVFPTSCAPAVQPEFNRAVAMLHSFWYHASESAFSEIAERDPGCAMAQWGIAMSRFHQLWAKPTAADLAVAQAALAKARSLEARTERERGFIEALGVFYRDAERVPHLDRMKAYERAMDDLRRRFPEDTEVAVFHALSMLGTAFASPQDKGYVRQKRASAILDSILTVHPDHPGVAHYIVHSHDYPELAADALRAARQYALIAPGAPHALHMPSHIFTRLGLWQESIASNRAAALAAHDGQWTGEELHATDYLMYAYLQGAQDGQAERIVAEAPAMWARLKDDDPNYWAGIYAAGAIPARYAVERRRWTEAAQLEIPTGLFPGGGRCWAEATLYYARGLGAAHAGAAPDAQRAVEELDRCIATLRQADEKLWVNLVEVQRRTVAAALALAQGQTEQALATMRAAADLEDQTDKPPVMPGPVAPARELLGEMLLQLERPAEALREFEAALAVSPNRYRSLEGAARAAERAGENQRSAKYYAALVQLVDAGR